MGQVALEGEYAEKVGTKRHTYHMQESICSDAIAPTL
jgi:hypothetical protein